MKRIIWLIVSLGKIISLTNCEKRATGIEASVMEFGNTEECYYILNLKNEFNEETRYVPINLPEEFKTYTNSNVIVSFKRTDDFCDCSWTRGASPDPWPGNPAPTYTLEKVEIKEIEFK